MREKNMRNTRYKILHCATQLFVEKGYTDAYLTTIAKQLKISTGNLSFHYPTKEHILAHLIEELFSLQRHVDADEYCGEHPMVVSYLFEHAIILSVCRNNPNIRDLFVSAYTSSMCLEIIRAYDTKRAMNIFKDFCPDWTETDFIQAENIVSGVEYALFRTENTQDISFEQKVISSIDAIMKIYEIPVNDRKRIVAQVMSMDYCSKGIGLFQDFCNYVEKMYVEE